MAFFLFPPTQERGEGDGICRPEEGSWAQSRYEGVPVTVEGPVVASERRRKVIRIRFPRNVKRAVAGEGGGIRNVLVPSTEECGKEETPTVHCPLRDVAVIVVAVIRVEGAHEREIVRTGRADDERCAICVDPDVMSCIRVCPAQIRGVVQDEPWIEHGPRAQLRYKSVICAAVESPVVGIHHGEVPGIGAAC